MWSLSIQGYNCTINYIEGKTNFCADLLSRLPNAPECEESSQEQEISPDISDRSYEVNVINSNEFRPQDFASCNYKDTDQLEKPDCMGYDMLLEQAKDQELSEMKSQLESGKASKATENKYLILDNILYYTYV